MQEVVTIFRIGNTRNWWWAVGNIHCTCLNILPNEWGHYVAIQCITGASLRSKSYDTIGLWGVWSINLRPNLITILLGGSTLL